VVHSSSITSFIKFAIIVYDSSPEGQKLPVQMLSSTFMGILLPAPFLATDRMKIYSPHRQTYLTQSLGQEGTVRAFCVFPPGSLVSSVEEFNSPSTRSAPLLIPGIVKKARHQGQPCLSLGDASTPRFFHWAPFVLQHSCVAVLSAPSLISPSLWPGSWPLIWASCLDLTPNSL